MPMINVFAPKGALTRAQVELLTEKLTHELLVIEGVDNDASRSIAWVMFHEVNAEQWAVGGRFDDHYVPEGGRFLVLVSVPLGGLFARGKKDDVAKSVDQAIREVLKLPAEEGKRWAHWGAGGLIRTLWEIGSYARKNVVALPDNHPASANGRRPILRCASADRRPMVGATVGEVLASGDRRFSPGDWVSGFRGWQTHALVKPGTPLNKVDVVRAPKSAYLSILGMTGVTAWMGLTQIRPPKSGQTFVVSAASGAVGSICRPDR